MKIVLFGLTGFGNAALTALLNLGWKPQLVVTRKDTFSYPYYPEIDLVGYAHDHGIPVAFGSGGETIVKNLCPDVILVASYHRILPADVLASAKVAVNIHPSLLPAYRGASPCYWVLRNGEPTSGVTAHFLTPEIDAGDILYQQRLTLDEAETQGSLRKKISAMAGTAAVQILQEFQSGSLTPRPQNPTLGSFFPRIGEKDWEINLSWTAAEIARHIRALSPWPKARLGGRVVNGFRVLEGLNVNRADICKVISTSRNYCEVLVGDSRVGIEVSEGNEGDVE